MFLGTHQHKLDDKGRLTLPAKFRDQLLGGMTVTRGSDHSLAIYPPEEYLRLAERAAAASKVDESARAYARSLNSNAEEVTPDSQGRIIISANLRRYAGLTKNCAVIGNFDYVEVWDEQRWELYQDTHEESVSRADDPALGTIL